eukprot:CAMPEP_0172477896 /NCGR_PEP_ID=MMETSP1066-20121228/1453_1 /TAXON_ID=671091 /ORGANISM="Coscinodiscus wailesii, Strain CCMP2513" /LENGTH=957 /DNA_ID=CAMNT_0013236915 /DNA_START=2961 /DNA_END=5834 /DNA_ORIENTATION=+
MCWGVDMAFIVPGGKLDIAAIDSNCSTWVPLFVYNARRQSGDREKGTMDFNEMDQCFSFSVHGFKSGSDFRSGSIEIFLKFLQESDDEILQIVLDDKLNYLNYTSGDVCVKTNSDVTDHARRSTTLTTKSAARMVVALSSEEARREWDLVKEATALLRSDKTIGSDEEKRMEERRDGVPIPPIYDATSSVWDTRHLVNTDDDEWLPRLRSDGVASSSLLTSLSSELALENILKADKICKKLISVRRWADDYTKDASATRNDGDAHDDADDDTSISLSYPGLFSIAKDIDVTTLQSLNREISDAVVIVRGERTLMDPTGTKSFAFCLNPERYPAVRLLRDKEESLLANVDASTRLLLERGSNNSPSNTKTLAIVKELESLRKELDAVEKQISQSLTMFILTAAETIDHGLDVVARLDVILSKAAFGIVAGGVVPDVGKEGIIDVKRFVHPVLSLGKYGSESGAETTPIDLIIGGKKGDEDGNALLISGPNGGEVGDGQKVAEGESTLMARLNKYAVMIEKLEQSNIPFDTNVVNENDSETPQPRYSLLLIDEMGGGTDPEASGALAQSILESLVSHGNARIVATTHSPRLKALSFEDERFQCATVLLRERRATDGNQHSAFQLPSYELRYGLIGDSYALGAAARCRPALPDAVITRAADLLAAGGSLDGDTVRATTASIERRERAAVRDAAAAARFREDSRKCRDVTIALARAYSQHFVRLEKRLDSIVKELQSDPSKDAHDIIGDSIGELRAVKKKVKSAEELLMERGLVRVPQDYEFQQGEQIVVISPGEWEGETVSVAADQSRATRDQVVVEPSLGHWGSSLSVDTFIDPSGSFDMNVNESTGSSRNVLFNRSEVALWDFPSEDNWRNDRAWQESFDKLYAVRSVPDLRTNLYNILKNLNHPGKDTMSTTSTGMKRATGSVETNTSNNRNKKSFTSSRERKAANKKDKRKEKRKR